MNPKPSGVAERLLAERIGLDPSSVGEALIARGVQTRMSALGLRLKTEYERILIGSLDEFQALVEEIVVPESWFFRDERPFELLGRFSLPWIADPARPPLTALSVPCASGEEPYSIAMTLLEAGLSSDQFRVDAVDVSGRSLAKAIAGVYGSNAFRGVASSRRSSYFRERSGAFTLDLAVRSTVRFHLGNLLDSGLFIDRGPFDVVFCRNLLIYLDDDAKTRALASLIRLVADGGLLFLGHADRLEVLEDSPFEPLAEKGSFAYRKAKAGVIGKATTDPNPPPQKGREAEAKKPKKRPLASSNPLPRSDGGITRHPHRPANFDSLPPSGSLSPCGGGLESGVARHDEEASISESASAIATGSATPLHPGPSPQEGREAELILDRASTLADSGQYREAQALVEQAVAEGSANPRAYYLLGMLAQASGLRDQAEAHYLKAIYLDPQYDEALLALALLARRKGDVAAEAGYRRRAERVRSRKVVT